jgi:hypothetical protein
VGYFDDPHQPYDQASKPSGGFFLEQQAKDKTDLIECNFDASPTSNVPRDWNSQDERLQLLASMKCPWQNSWCSVDECLRANNQFPYRSHQSSPKAI